MTGVTAQDNGVPAARTANPGTVEIYHLTGDIVMPFDALLGMIDLTMHPGQHQARDVMDHSVAAAHRQHRNRHD